MVRNLFIEQGQRAADRTAIAARDYLCKWARVGSVTKLFAHPADRQAYLVMCQKQVPLLPTPLPPPIKETEPRNVGT